MNGAVALQLPGPENGQTRRFITESSEPSGGIQPWKQAVWPGPVSWVKSPPQWQQGWVWDSALPGDSSGTPFLLT